jgi:hypothetical protein
MGSQGRPQDLGLGKGKGPEQQERWHHKPSMEPIWMLLPWQLDGTACPVCDPGPWTQSLSMVSVLPWKPRTQPPEWICLGHFSELPSSLLKVEVC